MSSLNAVQHYCGLFDCQVLLDLAERGGAALRPLETVYYLGSPPELGAGLWGYSLTPHFFSKDALERYCRSAKGKAAINKAAGETFVGQWDTERQCWKDDDANA